MKFSLNFIKEFFNPSLSPEGIAQRLTMAGLEVENIEKIGDDYVFDAEVTPNRYDWLSIFGISNELACLCKRRLKVELPYIETKPSLKELLIIIESKKDCPVYIARLIRGIKIGDPPDWLKKRVENCGIKSINNAVDITNYSMLKWGNPLHAFDFDKIEGNIYVRRAKNKEVFIGLDGKEYLLDNDNLVISDDKKIIALAGVMGAKNTEVDSGTKNILLETAIFSPLCVRRSRRSANLDTDSSYRFERNVSSKLLDAASFSAAQLLCELCSGTMRGYKKEGRNPSFTKRNINFSRTELDSYIGIDFSVSDIRNILYNLGFDIKTKGKKIVVKAPFFRMDISQKEDVFEEIARCYGYGRIKEEMPSLKPQGIKDSIYGFKNEIRDFLARLGLNEVITYSINNSDNLKDFGEADFIMLNNPLRSQENALRTTLLLGMLEAIKYNINQKNSFLKFFEIANVYKKRKEGFVELPMLSCAAAGSREFYYLKGVIKEILTFLNIDGAEFTSFKKNNFVNAVKVEYKDKILGFLGQVNSRVKRRFDIKDDINFFELDLKLALSLKTDRSYKTFSRFPVVYRDISIGLSKNIKFRDIEQIIRETAVKFLYSYKIIDMYKGKNEPEDLHIFTLRIFYSSRYKTLTADEVDKLHFRVRNQISRKEGVILR
ncbi:MAG: phenylalanine--tRNA ligase subunit beta [Candidatus Omnitrophica bacterium 4484_171]|nr:MAG: phenylalanine--tRNA ligase subunit beta [Candidatus Omnitrophica bacterium 4484_171]